MKPEKDIGEFIKSRIDETQTAPNDQVWEKINASLDKKSRKRRFIYLLLLFIGLPIIGSFWFLIPFNGSRQHSPIKEKISVEKITSTLPIISDEDLNKLQEGMNIVTTKTEHPTNASGEKESFSKEPKIDKSESSGKTKKNKLNPIAQKSFQEPSSIRAAIDSLTSTASSFKSQPQENTLIPTIAETDSIEDSTDSLTINEKNKRFSKSKKKDRTKDSITIEKPENKLWGFGLVTAGEYFGSLSDGSMIDHRLDGKRTKAEIHFQYGVSIHMRLSQRLEISYGASIVTYGYTNYLDHPDEALSLSAVNPSALSEYAGFVGNASSINVKQRISYIELPLQLSYRITQNRIGLEGLVGVSTFILNKNHIELIDENNNSIELGSANNLSKLNFSINAGVGSYYNFSNQIKFSLIPTIKYNFKTLNKRNYQRQENFSLGLYGTLTYYFNL